MDGLVGELGYGKIGTGLSFIGLVYLGFWLSSLPFDLYHTFVLEERFGFNKTTAKTYIIDQIKSHFLTAILGGGIVALILWIFDSVPNAWVWAWLSFTAISLALTYLAPSFLLPLFNKFTPLEDQELNEAIQSMADLMSKHTNQFVGRLTFNQGVEKCDFFALSKPRKKSIRLRGASGSIHDRNFS